eukprot:CAMPEP_0181084200 /NCGR_PEP_ID=MMETSP1071-20121207/4570_1 /TAXON_ID=35127 /ORGANISM="Thalassiosira sp., Strain NH16" /LENGTH=481 /DNA_ID=CAMNT_0023165921 /DNA_START=434 /DNA_END=1876 /DNA_ORIENTATION=-
MPSTLAKKNVHCRLALYHDARNESDGSGDDESGKINTSKRHTPSYETRHGASFSNDHRVRTLFMSTLLGAGPSGGATTSPPPNLITPSITDNSAKKLKQLIGSSLSENRLEQFSAQLDDLVTEALQNLLNTDGDGNDETSEGGTTKKYIIAKQEREAELQKLKILKKQIADRETLLSKLEKQPYWFNYLAAFIGSVASTLVMHPVDTIKTRLQVKGFSSTNNDGENGDDDDDDYNKKEGMGNMANLYEGLAGNILKEGPASALYLGVYESVKYALLPTQLGAQSVLLVYLASGAAGEMCGSVIRAPAEAIKSTVQSGMAGSALEAGAQVFGTKASRGNVVRAWSASIWRDVPFGALQLAIFELTKTYILNSPDIDFDSSTLLTEAIVGAFAGGWGALLTNPFDIITTRIITQPIDDDEAIIGDGGNKPLGVLEMGQKVYEEGGMAAFFVGWQARVGYWAPAISIFLTCYCSVRQAGVQHGW